MRRQPWCCGLLLSFNCLIADVIYSICALVSAQLGPLGPENEIRIKLLNKPTALFGILRCNLTMRYKDFIVLILCDLTLKREMCSLCQVKRKVSPPPGSINCAFVSAPLPPVDFLACDLSGFTRSRSVKSKIPKRQWPQNHRSPPHTHVLRQIGLGGWCD